jgi:hypothetical protein
MILGGYWSTYWYNGKIYGTEIARGMDVFSLVPSEFLSENEVAAAELAIQGELFNPQQQFPVSWPAEPVVARAYIDQLNRSNVLSETANAGLADALAQADALLADGATDDDVADGLVAIADSLEIGGDAMTQKRQSALAETLGGIAARLRQSSGD